MRSLLDSSSWTKFGPAGRDSLDWSSLGPSALPSTDTVGQSSGEAITTTQSITYIIIATVSFVLFLSIIGFLVLRRRRGFSLDAKLGVANVIVLEDLQDPERNCELLSSLRRSRGQHHRPPSCGSEEDAADGVFLMVYLPPPYEHTLTRIARAASTSSSKGAETPRGGDQEEAEPSQGPETRGGDHEEEPRLADTASDEED